MPLASTVSHRAKSLRAVKHLHGAKPIAPLNAGNGSGSECINRVTPRRRAQAPKGWKQGRTQPATTRCRPRFATL